MRRRKELISSKNAVYICGLMSPLNMLSSSISLAQNGSTILLTDDHPSFVRIFHSIVVSVLLWNHRSSFRHVNIADARLPNVAANVMR